MQVDQTANPNLGVANTSVSASLQDSLRGSLDEQLGSSSQLGGLEGHAVRGHRLPVSGELQGELLLPLGLHVLASDDGGGTAVQAGLGAVEGVDLLSQDDQSGLSGLTNLLHNIISSHQ